MEMLHDASEVSQMDLKKVFSGDRKTYRWRYHVIPFTLLTGVVITLMSSVLVYLGNVDYSRLNNSQRRFGHPNCLHLASAW